MVIKTLFQGGEEVGKGKRYTVGFQGVVISLSSILVTVHYNIHLSVSMHFSICSI